MVHPNASASPQHALVASATLAFLFSDIESSTERWEHFADAMHRAVARHDSIMRRAMEKEGGHIFKTVGDAVHAVFPQTFGALCAALEAQRALDADGFADVEGLRVRMAIHVGAVQARDSDFFGQPLNRLARMLALAHGGQVLVSDAAAGMIEGPLPKGMALLDLGQHRLRDIATAQRLYQLVAPDLPSEFPPLRSESPTRSNLPQQVTGLIGRETERNEIEALRQKYRLVTLVGPGGVGKTRVAMEVGREALTQYPDGVWLLELASLTDGQLVAETLATMFGGGIVLGRLALDTVVSFLRPKSLLLILDNCEHLVLAVAQSAEAIMRNCPGIDILATSRQPLAISGESIYRMPSLSFPEHPETTSVATALKYPAVRLFAERASAVISGFAIVNENVSAVCTICKRLDGVPLAIEIAVPQLRALKPHELANRLDDRFRIPASGTRTALPRQQTLQSVFEWSYNLLNADEQILLKRLSVFSGGFTFESAVAVTADDAIAEGNLFDILSFLVDKSLVTIDAGGIETRYRLLESTRSFALKRLLDSGEGNIRHRLCQFLISFYARAAAEWPEKSTESWLETYAPDLDNLRASLEWAFGTEGKVELGLELASHSLRLMLELSLFPEIKRWFEISAAHVQDETPTLVRARLLYAKSYMQHALFGGRGAAQPALEGAAFFRACGEMLELAECLVRAGQAVASPGNTREARRFLEEGYSLLSPDRHTKVKASCLLSLGVVSDFEGNFADGYTLLSEAAEIFHAIGDNFGMRFVLICLAENRFNSGEFASALVSVKQAIDLATKHNHRHTVSLARMNLAAYLLVLGRTGEAREEALESLKDANALGLSSYIVILIEHLALAAAMSGRGEQAARMLGYSEAQRLVSGTTREGTEQKIHERLAPLIVSASPPGRRAKLAAEGAAWTESQAVENAMTV